jgi:tetratricopeptide (TPR) repeat protein
MDLNNILELEKRVSENPLSPLGVRLASYYLESRVKIPKAIELCRNILNKYSDYETAYYILAKCYTVEKDYQSAHKLIQKAKGKFFQQNILNSLNTIIYELIAEDGFKADFLANSSNIVFSPASNNTLDIDIPSTELQIDNTKGEFSSLKEKPDFGDIFNDYVSQTDEKQDLSGIDKLVEKHKRSFLPNINEMNNIIQESEMEIPIIDIQDMTKIDTIIEEQKENILPKVIESPTIKEIVTNDIYFKPSHNKQLLFDEEYITHEDFEKLKKTDKEINDIKSEIFDIPDDLPIDSHSVSIDKDLIIDDLLLDHFKAEEENITPKAEDKIIDTGNNDGVLNIKEIEDLPLPDISLNEPLQDIESNSETIFIPGEEDTLQPGDQKNAPEKYNLLHEIAKLNGDDSPIEHAPEIPIHEEISDKEIASKIKQGELPEKFINKTLAQIYESQGKIEEAIEVYNQLFINDKITIPEYEARMVELKAKLLKANPTESDFLI